MSAVASFPHLNPYFQPAPIFLIPTLYPRILPIPGIPNFVRHVRLIPISSSPFPLFRCPSPHSVYDKQTLRPKTAKNYIMIVEKKITRRKCFRLQSSTNILFRTFGDGMQITQNGMRYINPHLTMNAVKTLHRKETVARRCP